MENSDARKKYKATAVAFLSLRGGGSQQIKKLDDYPGIVVISTKEHKDAKWEIAFFFGELKFFDIAKCIEAYKKANPDFKEPL